MNHRQSTADAIEAEANTRALAAVQEREADHERLHEILQSIDDGESIADHVEQHFLDGHTLDECLEKLQALIRP